MALFNGKTLENPREDVSSEFQFLLVWTVLLNMPRFSAGDQMKKTEDVSSGRTGKRAMNSRWHSCQSQEGEGGAR